tara:strand:+ start:75609 stop:77072 length:1464 start_codon:yes stop_codon:yes gene_type:complete
MKLLKDILYKVPILESIGSTNQAISKLAFDSRQVNKESLFIAIKGSTVDGHLYIKTAIENGARSIICEELPEEIQEGITYIKVKDSHSSLGIIASNFYNNPSGQLKLVGITGTNGKTTTSTLLYSLFQSLGIKSGLLSTVCIKVGREEFPATHTTPDPIQLNFYLQKMVEQGCKVCFMEASSHGIEQKRIAGLDFAGAVFTNISHDHLDYHKTFDDYILAKKGLFDQLSSNAFALVNSDDRHGFTMLHHCKAKKYSFGLRSDADYKVKILEHQFNGMLLKINQHELWTKLIGNFNAYNLIAVYAVSVLLEKDDLQVATAISNLSSVEGRFQYFQSKNGITAIIDYAHTPDALKNVLETIAKIRAGNEKLFTLIGCGGDRDKTKRPEMARIATELSDQTILTSDNPRSEDPDEIIREMEEGIEMHLQNKYLSITNRKEAIKTACRMAQSGDIILIAGKGHEKYQDINGQKNPFDDMQFAQEFLNPSQE